MSAKAQRNASGPYLREVRTKLGLSKEVAAVALGVSVRTLERYERNGLSLNMLWFRFCNICDTYRVSCDDLLRLMHEPIE